ncbi:FadR/GntR family transcriptional regulator [uncultured Leifsonia sp.]|uniref:FadR/GntR family transcriptional regulator n=1 Tax=uncultured Leifsonia sp. TaxID=340359 RepID=UPI0028D02E0A|nr:FadR/GntR family transcriptional regulator [uncultured Leifsonia sp.]
MHPIAPPVTLPEQVAEQLRTRIAAGEFPIGSLLPGETELARQLQVSRNSVREALRSLVHAGLLGARAGYGTFVLATNDVAPTLARRLGQERDADVAEVRMLLEREGARLAALRRTPEQVDRLRDALAARTALIGRPGYDDADVAFHQALLDASGNALLAELYRGVGGNERALEALRDHVETGEGGEPAATDIDEAHGPIVEAVAAGDPDAAVAAAERMVRLINDRLGVATAAREGDR